MLNVWGTWDWATLNFHDVKQRPGATGLTTGDNLGCFIYTHSLAALLSWVESGHEEALVFLGPVLGAFSLSRNQKMCSTVCETAHCTRYVTLVDKLGIFVWEWVKWCYFVLHPIKIGGRVFCIAESISPIRSRMNAQEVGRSTLMCGSCSGSKSWKEV